MAYGNYIGIMSGTSLDGIDLVLATISAEGIKEKGSYSHPLPNDVKHAILALCQGQQTTLSQLGQLDIRLGQLFGQAVIQLLKQQHCSAQNIQAIGNHGQTVWHEPQSAYPNTLQIADNNQISALTGITTIGDFRRRDMAYGGQGAPLVPAFHHALLSCAEEQRIIVNIGGIANITRLYPQQTVLGFDTGPGNMLMDAWISQQRQLAYDKDGQWALTGTVNTALLTQMLQDNYFHRSPPKSTGREYFNLAWLTQQLAAFNSIDAADVQATLLELTAYTISQAILQQPTCQRVLLCGGGAHNQALRQRISQLLAPITVGITDDLGVSADNLEALAFAWLAYRTLSGQTGNLPAVTGARQATILGAVYYP